MKNAIWPAAGFLFALGVAQPAGAGDIITEWGGVQAPKAPELKPASIDAKTTALLLLDFVPHDPYCGPGKPRCGATLPILKQLLSKARASGATIVYSVAGKYEAADIAKDIAPAAIDPVVKSKADKFVNTDLEKILKDKGIQTVIMTGTAANGAVLYTATGAALRGMKLVIPVDGMSGKELFEEQLTAWQLAHGPGFANLVTMTRSDMITFH